ncbi:dihydrodipicolinate synthase family protein [Larkinella terrae]|uniref:Dihydrodipicolinate synthase family protein n=1 Tax=Larkinella terrae TaxID=2025311 RepID=A0A7K0ESN4_9BACT|nr:dihydrodipicolinate synthase family protein [Larkinella terrae]MRS64782.1 dihydrodipicolinate synthase family protein [Larkinella terrae]
MIPEQTAPPRKTGKPLEAADIRGNWATLMLPINDDDRIDFARLADEIDALIGFGVDGIYSNGTAGEFYNQTETEFDRIHELLARKCHAAGMPFQIGVSHMSPILSLERLKRSLPWEPGAVQVILPDWFPTVEAEQIAFLRKMAAVSETVRLVLYNPPHAKIRLSPEEFGRLKIAVPQLVGVKVPGGSADWYTQMRQHMSDLSVFVPGHFLATGIREGAHGAYSNVACLHPKVAQDWYNRMQTDLPAALAWEARIQQFMSEFIAPYINDQRFPNQACDKMLAVVGGWANVGSRLRWPYRFIPESEAGRVREAAQRLIPEFFPTNENRPPYVA